MRDHIGDASTSGNCDSGVSRYTTAATHMDRAGAETLNKMRAVLRFSTVRRNEITRASHATPMAAAAGPNSRAAVMVNVSASEMLIGKPGIRRGRDAATRVKPRR